jgi:hypothetical protein
VRCASRGGFFGLRPTWVDAATGTQTGGTVTVTTSHVACGRGFYWSEPRYTVEDTESYPAVKPFSYEIEGSTGAKLYFYPGGTTQSKQGVVAECHKIDTTNLIEGILWSPFAVAAIIILLVLLFGGAVGAGSGVLHGSATRGIWGGWNIRIWK